MKSPNVIPPVGDDNVDNRDDSDNEDDGDPSIFKIKKITTCVIFIDCFKDKMCIFSRLS